MKKLLTFLFLLVSINLFAQNDTTTIIPERPGNCYGGIVIPTHRTQIDYGLGRFSDLTINYFQIRNAISKRIEVKIGSGFNGKTLLDLVLALNLI